MIVITVYNFSAGPSMLPQPIKKRAIRDMTDYHGTGISVMDMNYRSQVYMSIHEDTEYLLRKLMNIPEDYTVLFLHSGASQQFIMVPMNLMSNNRKADYISTGIWSKKAIDEAKLVGCVNIAATSEDKNFSYIPENYSFSLDADYVHITLNNTLEGTRFTKLPDTGDIPLVADMSSNILSEEIDVTKFGLIHAGAQKNLGPSGVSIVIIRNDLLDKHSENIPIILQYNSYAKNKALYNCLQGYNLYMLSLVLEWIDKMGGIKEMERINNKKAEILYSFLDESKLFSSHVKVRDRSLTNVPFTTSKDELDEKFVIEAAKEGLCMLQGHELVGGLRASIYNAMPVRGVKKLVQFMEKFEVANS